MPVVRPKIISNEGALRIPLPGAQKIWFIYETWQKLGGPMTIRSINELHWPIFLFLKINLVESFVNQKIH